MISQTLTVFNQEKQIASGSVMAVIEILLTFNNATSYLVFNDQNGTVIEIDLRGTAQEIYAKVIETYPALKEVATSTTDHSEIIKAEEKTTTRGRGRPKLGVIAKEVTLLPRHWEWLSEQPSGASATLRRLIEDAKKKYAAQDLLQKRQTRTYQFMMATAGNLPLYEDALRALFADDLTTLSQCIATWPIDIRHYIEKLLSF